MMFVAEGTENDEGSSVQLITEGLWQLTGWPRDMFNVYLAGDVLIDAATRWAKRRIVRQLKGRSLRMIALTHCHPDHQGVAKFLCEHFRVPLACHKADVPVMEGRVPMRPQHWIVRLGERFWAGPPHPVKRVLQDGDEVAGFRVIHTPGHTPGHVIYFRESDPACGNRRRSSPSIRPRTGSRSRS
jgi:hydroxyacylglutathione hydrolase